MKRIINIGIITALFLVIVAPTVMPVQAEDDDDNGFRTPGYWKTHPDIWPTSYSTLMTLETVFASTPSELAGTTLLQALSLNGGEGAQGAQRILARAAVAGLLNAENFGSGDGAYPLSVEQVISLVNGAFNPGSRDKMISLAEELDSYNNLD